MKMTTWPRLWLGVRGVLCVAQFSWMSLATNERNKTGMWCWGETIKEKRNTSICVPLIVLIFSFAIFNSFFFFVGRGGSSERNHPSDSACALLCSAWSGPPPSVCLFFFCFKRETQWNDSKWGTGGHQVAHPSARQIFTSSSFLFSIFQFAFLLHCTPNP